MGEDDTADTQKHTSRLGWHSGNLNRDHQLQKNVLLVWKDLKINVHMDWFYKLSESVHLILSNIKAVIVSVCWSLPDCQIWAGSQPLLLLIILKFPIPAVRGDVARDQMMLRHKRHEPLPALAVPGVARLYPEVDHASAQLHVLSSIILETTHLAIINTVLEKTWLD